MSPRIPPFRKSVAQQNETTPSPFGYVHSNAVNLHESVTLFHDFSSFAKETKSPATHVEGTQAYRCRGPLNAVNLHLRQAVAPIPPKFVLLSVTRLPRTALSP